MLERSFQKKKRKTTLGVFRLGCEFQTVDQFIAIMLNRYCKTPGAGAIFLSSARNTPSRLDGLSTSLRWIETLVLALVLEVFEPPWSRGC